MSVAKAFTFDIGSSVSPTMVTPLSLYLSFNSIRCGIDLRQGGHHVAQNSTTTMFLLSLARLTPSLFSHSAALISGAAVPTAGSAARRPAEIANARRIAGKVRDDFMNPKSFQSNATRLASH